MYIVMRDGQPTRWDANDGLLPHSERDPRFPLAHRTVATFLTEPAAKQAIEATQEVLDGKHGKATTPPVFDTLELWERPYPSVPFSLLEGEPGACERDEITDGTDRR